MIYMEAQRPPLPKDKVNAFLLRNKRVLIDTLLLYIWRQGGKFLAKEEHLGELSHETY